MSRRETGTAHGGVVLPVSIFTRHFFGAEQRLVSARGKWRELVLLHATPAVLCDYHILLLECVVVAIANLQRARLKNIYHFQPENLVCYLNEF